jgi:hypothetical protein
MFIFAFVTLLFMQLCDLLPLRTMPVIRNIIAGDTDGYTMGSKPTPLMIPCFAGAGFQ